MATGLEVVLGANLALLFGNPIFVGIMLFAFFIAILVFGRVGLMAGTPIMIATGILVGELVPQFRVPFFIVLGMIVGYGFLRLYRGQ